MLIIKKQRNNSPSSNKGVNVTINFKGRIGFNFSKEVTALLPEFIIVGCEGDKLYFLEAKSEEGYKVTKKGTVGRISFPAGENLLHLKPFIGNHMAFRGLAGLFIEVNK